MDQRLTTPTPGPLKLTAEQYGRLLTPIHPDRVRSLQGNSYVEAWDVRRQLTRIFGFGGWTFEALDTVCASERSVPHPTRPDRMQHTVVYRVIGRLTVYGADGTFAFYDDAASGDASNLPGLGDAHDFALKSAMSAALKRCAVNLGDQFGLSLYNKGNTDAVVVGTFLPPESAQPAQTEQLTDTVEGGEMDEQPAGDEPDRATDTADLARRARQQQDLAAAQADIAEDPHDADGHMARAAVAMIEGRPPTPPVPGAVNSPVDVQAQIAARIAEAAKKVLTQANQANQTTKTIETLVANTNPQVMDSPAIPGDENSPTVREALKARWHELNAANTRPVPANA